MFILEVKTLFDGVFNSDYGFNVYPAQFWTIDGDWARQNVLRYGDNFCLIGQDKSLGRFGDSGPNASTWTQVTHPGAELQRKKNIALPISKKTFLVISNAAVIKVWFYGWFRYTGRGSLSDRQLSSV